jgi:lipid-A-disaccharide synthase
VAQNAHLIGVAVTGNTSGLDKSSSVVQSANKLAMFVAASQAPKSSEHSASKMESVSGAEPLKIFLVAGEHSGDALGAKLIRALTKLHPEPIAFSGVGGEEMAEQGFRSLFPIEDVAVMGPMSILPKLPLILRRVYQTVDAGIAFAPDVVVIIDSPEFTHPIAKRIRKRAPHIPIVDYVSPSVWAWRPGRAKKMRPYVDHILALLPFEPEAHERLGGPPCTYVGHPLIEKLDDIRNADAGGLASRLGIAPDRPVLLVLPGSRRSEVDRLLDVFGEAVARIAFSQQQIEVVIPAVRHLRERIADRTATWTPKPHIIDAGTDDKYAAMRLARAALAASGTVTLELALAATPSVVAYKVDKIMANLRFLLKVPSIVLANLVIGKNVYPEYLQEECTAENLANAIEPLLSESEARTAELDALALAPQKLRLAASSPSEAAAGVVLSVVSDQAAGKFRRGGPM